VLAQVAFADRMIINKVDLVSEEERRALRNRLQSMNSMAGIYEATMGDAPIADLLDIGGFNVQRAVDIKPTFLKPEYPFEKASLWRLPVGGYSLTMVEVESHEQSIDRHHLHSHDHSHDHDHDHGHGHGHGHASTPDMPLLMTQSESGGDLQKLAEQVFVEFSTEPEVLEHGQAIGSFDQHYQLTLEGRSQYEFGFSLGGDQAVAMFVGSAPSELELQVISDSGEKQIPVAIETFQAEHSHDSQVSSCSIELPGALDVVKLNAWLDEFLTENGPDIYRMKGVVAIEDQDYRFVFQGVHMIFGSERGAEWGEEEPHNRLVFIGKNLDEAYISASLERCLAGRSWDHCE